MLEACAGVGMGVGVLMLMGQRGSACWSGMLREFERNFSICVFLLLRHSKITRIPHGTGLIRI